MDYVNVSLALISVALGLFGWLAPRYTMAALDLAAGASSMGPSEIRASVGALFVGLGAGALLIGDATAYVMLGAAWTGAAIGRGTSLALDGQTAKKWLYFTVEAAVALTAIAGNVGTL